ALVQGSSTHAFETMLSAFILGIALGGLWIRKRIERYASPMLALACVQILMGLAALATLPAYNYAFDAMAGAMAVLPRNTLGYLGFNVAGYLISATIMVPAAFFAGMTLPLLTFLLYSRGRGEADIGAVYGWNTFGGILGTALGGLVLLPLIGLKDLLVAGAAIDIALGLALGAVLLRRGQLTAPRRAALTALAAAAVIGVFSALTLFDFDPTRMASGVFRHGRAQIREGSEVTFHADGRTASVDVIVDVLGGTSIATNGKVDASINMNRARGDRDAPAAPDEYTMTAAAALPLAYAPEARRAAIIGHGSGLTTHVLLASPLVEQVDVIEIEPEMIRGAREFLPRVQRAYNDPRARYFVEDARAFFARAAKRYDVIISEPSNPWVSGVASLFTPEYYRQAKRALSPNGLFVQWFQIYETDQALVASIVRAIGTVFPDYVLYSATSTNVVLVATPAGPLPTPSDALFAWPEMRAELDYLGIRTPRDLTLFRIGSRRTYAPLLETGRMNSDYFPFLEFGAARARFLDTHFAALLQNVRYPVPTIEILSGFDPPELPGPSVRLASINLRLLDVHRTAVFAGVLESGNPPSGADAVMLLDSDRQNLQTVLDVPADGTTTAWRTWYSALFALSEPMIPNGGFRSFERFVRSERVSVALRGAPQDVRDKIEFLLLVGARDLEGIRREGAQLLAGELHKTDPVFHAHVFVATMSACLAETPNASCRDLLRQLDRVRRGTPIVDLLRAHKAALP
ncbi:MAG TPA: hypothetical protein VFJ48_02400, partial [Casimicrobiaceae bacterium]|nr:hypothetical protein [Casimicrobiaceae bacterium]